MITKFNNEIYGLLPDGIEGVDSLAKLALDMSWSWNHVTDQLWQDLDPALWEHTRNPWLVLQTVSRERLEKQMADPVFREKINNLIKSPEHAKQFNDLINHQSGLLGISGTSSDRRDLLRIEKGSEDVSLSIEIFCYQIKKNIGGYAVELGGLDTLIFSGGIEENSATIRSRIC